MGQFVIVAYRPKAGKEAELLELLKNHVPTLQGEGLATERLPYLMHSADGTFAYDFEWHSAEAIERAYTNKVVLEMWGKFSAAYEIDAIANLEESKTMF